MTPTETDKFTVKLIKGRGDKRPLVSVLYICSVNVLLHKEFKLISFSFDL